MIRPPTQDELPFIRETCCKVRQPIGRDGGRVVGWGAWKAEHGPPVDRWLADGEVRVYVADEAPDIVLGFAVLHQQRVAMLYVKRDFRGNGIGRALLGNPGPDTAVACVWPTACLRKWARYHGLRLVADPVAVAA